MANETDDRLDRLLEEARLAHEMAVLNGGSGNRDYESTAGALMALNRAKEVLATEPDPTTAQVEGQVVRNIVRLKLFGVLTLNKTRGGEWLYIGSRQDLSPHTPQGGVHVEYEFVDTLKGTRVEVMRQFLERQRQS